MIPLEPFISYVDMYIWIDTCWIQRLSSLRGGASRPSGPPKRNAACMAISPPPARSVKWISCSSQSPPVVSWFWKETYTTPMPLILVSVTTKLADITSAQVTFSTNNVLTAMSLSPTFPFVDWKKVVDFHLLIHLWFFGTAFLLPMYCKRITMVFLVLLCFPRPRDARKRIPAWQRRHRRQSRMQCNLERETNWKLTNSVWCATNAIW